MGSVIRKFMFQLFMKKPDETQWQFVTICLQKHHAQNIVDKLCFQGCEMSWIDLTKQEHPHCG